MQALFSRAAKAQFCNCRTCGHVAHTVIRRTTTAPSRQKKKSNFTELFTACYTTILGTAAVLDARHKDRRREDLDRQLDEARTKLHRLKESSPPTPDVTPAGKLARFPLNILPDFSLDSITALKSICKTEAALIRHEESLPHHRNFLRYFHRVYKPDQDLAEIWTAKRGVSFGLIRHALEDEQTNSQYRQREPMSPLQFERFHDMINMLVDALVKQAYEDAYPGNPEAARRSLDSLDSAWTAIRLLRSDGYPRYNHPDLDPAETRTTRERLNQANKDVLATWNDPAKPHKFLVAKICYNLLVSSVPPGIHNYNALIFGFTGVGRHKLAGLVVDSLLNNSRLLPTPQTVVCLLVHYRSKGDISGFYGILRRLTAINNRGLLQRRRWYEDVSDIPILQQWAKDPEVTRSLPGNWYIQLPRRDHDIYEAIISGLLQFGRVKDAAKVFVGALGERWGISVHLMVELLRECRHTLNVAAARILIRGFLDNIDIMTTLLYRDDCPRKMAQHMYVIFDLCLVQLDRALDLPSRPKVQAVVNGDARKLRQLETALFTKNTEYRLHQLNYIIRRMRHIRRDGNFPLVMDSVRRAISELEQLEGHYASLAQDVLDIKCLAKVRNWIQSETWKLTPRSMARTHAASQDSQEQVVHLLWRGLPKFKPDAISRLAERWILYRLSRQKESMSEFSRLEFEIDAALSSGEDLAEEVRVTAQRLPRQGLPRNLRHVKGPFALLT